MADLTPFPSLALFIFVLTVTGIVSKILREFNVVDNHNNRSMHSTTATRGLGILLGTSLSIILGFVLISHPSGQAIALWAACVSFTLLGFLEDTIGLRIIVRLAGQMFLGILIGYVFLWDPTYIGFSWLPFCMAVYIVVFVNAANFMDGINGLSAFTGVISGIYFGIIVAEGTHSYPSGFLVAAVFAAFAPWNIFVNGTFLGDSGSYLLGGTMAVMSIEVFLAFRSIPMALAPMIIYLADVGTTLIIRIVRGERWHEPHRSHAFQILSLSGFTHLQVSSLIAILTLINCLYGWVAWHYSNLADAMLFFQVFTSLGWVIWARGKKLRRPGH